MNETSHPEPFKSYGETLRPDPRSRLFMPLDAQADTALLQALHSQVGRFMLQAQVPNEVVSHFNTARNLLLYTWFVYGFYPVAELHVLTTLELALRLRCNAEHGTRQRQPIGLKKYIATAIEKQWVRNEDFRAYHRIPYEEAKFNYLTQKMREMETAGLNEITLNDDEIEVPAENTADYLNILLNTVNQTRNFHAHGELMLNPAGTWLIFEICTDFINALFRNNQPATD